MSQHPGRFTTVNQPGAYGRKVRGPPPSMVPTACTACGKVRWLHPVSIAASSGLCIKCARRKQRKKLMTKNHVSLRERLQIAQFLDAHTEPDGNGFIKYANGVADDAAAAKLLTDAMGRMVTVDNVRATRLSVCGKLHRPGGSPEEMAAMRAKLAAKRGRNNDAVLDAIAELRQEVRELRQSLERTGDVPNPAYLAEVRQQARANGPLIYG